MARARLTQKPFPSYTHRPGLTTHPNKPGGHQYNQAEPKADPLVRGSFLSHEYYRYGLDLLNHGYFWESHVAFEAIWNAHHRTGHEANALKALIKLAAAGVKAQAQSTAATIGHLERAQELTQAVDLTIWDEVLGFEQSELLRQIEQLKKGPPFLGDNNCFIFELSPKSK
jgi:uncharacterized protein